MKATEVSFSLEEAQKAAKEGKRVTNDLLDDNEYVTFKNNVFINQNGQKLHWGTFWDVLGPNNWKLF